MPRNAVSKLLKTWAGRPDKKWQGGLSRMLLVEKPAGQLVLQIRSAQEIGSLLSLGVLPPLALECSPLPSVGSAEHGRDNSGIPR